MVKSRIEKLLQKEFYCSKEELNSKEIVYTINDIVNVPFIKILAYRNSVIVCTSFDLHDDIKKLINGKNRDEIFELPYVYGQTIHFVPDNNYSIKKVNTPLEFDFEFVCDEDIKGLFGISGFDNSLSFDENGDTPAKAVYVARKNDEIVGVAGASETSVDALLEIGVDVMNDYRYAHLATYLVSKLTERLLSEDIVSFYSASVTNIGSQMVASRCGYIPCWIDTYGTTLDGSSVYNEVVKKMNKLLSKR